MDELHRLGVVVDHLIGAKLVHKRVVPRGGRADHFGAFPFGDLDREMPTPPAAAWISTRWRATISAASNKHCHTVNSASGNTAEMDVIDCRGFRRVRVMGPP